MTRKRRRRWLRRSLLLLVVLFAGAVGISLLALLPVRTSLTQARAHLVGGRQALAAGDLADARMSFSSAEDDFEAALGRLDGPQIRFLGALPILGRTTDAVSGLAEGGALVARSGSVVARSLAALPGGLEALMPQAGGIPTEPMDALHEPLLRARDMVAEAQRVSDGPRTWLLPPVAGPVETFDFEVRDLRRTLDVAVALTEALPQFLGQDGTRRYFFGAQNPAELRGTGGLLGAYSILTVTEGSIDLAPFRPIIQLDDVPPGTVEPPNPDYEEMYDRFGGTGFWRNLNMTPDLPSAATAIERLYEHVQGVRLDGTIVADPEALASLMSVTGSVRAPGAGLVEPGEMVAFLSNEAFSVYSDPGARKRILGQMAERVLNTYLAEASTDRRAAGRALVDAASGGHLMIHAADPAIQRNLHVAGITGQLPRTPGDRFALVVNNAGGNKVDFYTDRTVRYEMTLLPDGVGEADVTVSYVNEAPDEGQPAYVIGPFRGVSDAGENVMITSAFCGSCRVHDVGLEGEPTGVTLGEELGYSVVTKTLQLPSGAGQEVGYEWTVLDAWKRADGAGVYTLTILGQPTIRPTRATIEISLPRGMAVVGTSPGMEEEAGTVTWTGTLEGVQTFEVRFVRPLSVRVLDLFFPGLAA
jgi:hypothetical protein